MAGGIATSPVTGALGGLTLAGLTVIQIGQQCTTAVADRRVTHPPSRSS